MAPNRNLPTVKLSVSRKIILVALGVVAAASLTLILFFTFSFESTLERLDVENIQGRLRLRKERFRSTLEMLGQDVRFLSKSNFVARYIRARSTGGVELSTGRTAGDIKKWMANTFVDFLEAKPDYLQARFIEGGAEGREIVRVQRKGGKIIRVADGKLQSKAGETYFQEAMKLPPETLIFSRITFNRENGKIERPPRPVLRGIIPVGNGRGGVFGLVVINMDAKGLLDGISQGVEEGFRLHLADEEGDYLIHPDPALAFGFEQGRHRHIREDFPALAPHLQADTWTSIHPKGLSDGALGQVIVTQRIAPPYDGPHPPRYWTLVEAAPYATVTRETQPLRWSALLISLCLLGMAGVVMFLLVHRLLRPLEQMAAAVRGYRPDAPPPVIPVDSHDEIGELGRQFQQLIQEISTREQALMASERRYRDLIEGSLQGIIIIQGEDVVFANRAFLMGLNVPSLRSIRTLARLKTFLLPSYRNFVEIAIMDAMEGEEVPRRFRLRAQRRDGYNMVMDVLARVVSWNDRSAFQATLMDITRQVQAVEELNRSEAQMRLLLEKIHGLPWQMDGATLRFGYVGPQAEELLGFPRREWLKQNFRQNHIHPEDLPWVSDKIHRGAARGGNFELEYRMIRRDGQVVWLRDVIHVVPAIRGRKTLVGVSINITQARLTEDQLRHSLKMEAIGQLTGGVAHDFNNLLTVIIGNLGLLKSRVDPQTLAYALVEDAADAALRGANLTRQLLAFAHKHPQKKELMDLATLVEGMTGLLERSLGETIRLEIRPPENLWPVVLDKTQLGNALINLAVNSRDAMEEGGNLEIEMENTHLTPEQAQDLGADPGPYVVLKVRDTGQGMTREVLARAYDPFFTTKGVGRGSGLGLSMVHGFVTQSGGVVHLDSQVGKGTRASLYFPALENQSVPAVPQEDLKREKMEAKNGDRPLDGRVILVVEDDTALRHMLEKLMDKMGCRVLAAADGPEGLALLESHPEIDLLFSDVVMPEGMDGVALATQALLLRPRLKVLLTSGYSPRHSNDQDFPFELLPKPYNLNDLRDKILELLAQPPSSADLADPLLPLA